MLDTFYDCLMSHTDPRKMVCGIKVIFSIDKIGINGVIYFFLLLLSRNLQAKIWQNVMNTIIYIKYITIQSRAAFSLLWLKPINTSLTCTKCWHHLQTNANLSLLLMVASISICTLLMLTDNAGKFCWQISRNLSTNIQKSVDKLKWHLLEVKTS